MGLKVYVAASSQEIERARFWMNCLRLAEVDVVSCWPDLIAKVGVANPRDASVTDRARWAANCLDGVRRADILWLLFPSTPTSGAFIEQGFAWAQGKRLVLSGDTARSVFSALGTEFAQDFEAYRHLVALNVRDQKSPGRQPEGQSAVASIRDLVDAEASGSATPSESAHVDSATAQTISSAVDDYAKSQAEYSQSCIAPKRGRR